MVAVHAASAGDLAPLQPAETSLSGDATIYGWLPTVTGNVGLNGFGPADIPEDSGASILDVLDGFFMGNAAVRRGDWGVFGDVVWADLGQENTSANGYLNAETGLSALVGTAALTYSLVDTPDAHLDLLAGARLWSVDVSLDLTGGLPDVHEDETVSWVDPVVGLRGRHMISERVFVAGTGVIGGFGIGSDFMWDAAATIGYNFNDSFSASLGYRALGADYSHSGDVVDITAHGPVIGLTGRF